MFKHEAQFTPEWSREIIGITLPTCLLLKSGSTDVGPWQMPAVIPLSIGKSQSEAVQSLALNVSYNYPFQELFTFSSDGSSTTAGYLEETE